VLEHSECLDNATLVENARTKSQRHLLAISRRRSLDDVVTDVLVERGDRSVLLSAAANPGRNSRIRALELWSTARNKMMSSPIALDRDATFPVIISSS
jgi:uncharacterized protein (DUF2336 family)